MVDDACATAELVRRGEASPAEVIDAAIERIEKLNPGLNAVIIDRFEEARKEAAGDLPDGPLRGVPWVIKDLGVLIAGSAHFGGIRGVRDAGYAADDDSVLVQRLRAAGAICVGKTNTPELGLIPTTEPEAFGPSRNPHDPTRSTGGCRAVGRRPRWRAAWSPSATPTTAAGPSASPPRSAGSWGSSRHEAASRTGPRPRSSGPGSSCRAS